MVPTPVIKALAVFHHHLGRSLASIVVLSLASAAFYGLAAVLQHEAAVQEPPNLSMQAGLLIRLVARPRWLLGTALDCVAYVFQFLALRRGSLALVEPILVLSLVFALPVAARLNHLAPRGCRPAGGWFGRGLRLCGCTHGADRAPS